VHRASWEFAIVAVAAASDFVDGKLARYVGASRAGAVLDRSPTRSSRPPRSSRSPAAAP